MPKPSPISSIFIEIGTKNTIESSKKSNFNIARMAKTAAIGSAANQYHSKAIAKVFSNKKAPTIK
jgi:hypothetical protein